MNSGDVMGCGLMGLSETSMQDRLEGCHDVAVCCVLNDGRIGRWPLSSSMLDAFMLSGQLRHVAEPDFLLHDTRYDAGTRRDMLVITDSRVPTVVTLAPIERHEICEQPFCDRMLTSASWYVDSCGIFEVKQPELRKRCR